MIKLYPEKLKIFPKPTRVIIKKLANRIFRYNQNALVLVVGETGSGKSYSTLALIYGIYLYTHGYAPSDDEMLEHVKWRAIDFMKSMRNTEKLTKGDAWCWDEAGIDAGNQEWASLKNKIISWYAQTCRNQNQIVFFTVPTLSMITPQVRKLLHFYIEAVGVNNNLKMGVLKPLRMQYNTRMDKIYYHRVKRKTKDGYVAEIRLVGVPYLHQSLYDAYERGKKEFTISLNEEIGQILQLIEDKKRKTLNVSMRPNHEQIYVLYHTYNTSSVAIAPKLNKASSTISQTMNVMDRLYPGWRNNKYLLGDLRTRKI